MIAPVINETFHWCWCCLIHCYCCLINSSDSPSCCLSASAGHVCLSSSLISQLRLLLVHILYLQLISWWWWYCSIGASSKQARKFSTFCSLWLCRSQFSCTHWDTSPQLIGRMPSMPDGQSVVFYRCQPNLKWTGEGESGSRRIIFNCFGSENNCRSKFPLCWVTAKKKILCLIINETHVCLLYIFALSLCSSMLGSVKHLNALSTLSTSNMP